MDKRWKDMKGELGISDDTPLEMGTKANQPLR